MLPCPVHEPDDPACGETDMCPVEMTVTVTNGRLKGAGGRVLNVKDECGRHVVIFEDDLTGRRRTVDALRVSVDGRP